MSVPVHFGGVECAGYQPGGGQGWGMGWYGMVDGGWDGMGQVEWSNIPGMVIRVVLRLAMSDKLGWQEGPFCERPSVFLLG
jgi:hypothetical protein